MVVMIGIGHWTVDNVDNFWRDGIQVEALRGSTRTRRIVPTADMGQLEWTVDMSLRNEDYGIWCKIAIQV